MSRRTISAVLLAISALLYATRYLAAAIFGSAMSSHNAELFEAMLQYTGQGLVTWSRIALVAGVIYLVWAEVDGILAHRNSKDTH